MSSCKTCIWKTWACPEWMCMNPKHPNYSNDDYPNIIELDGYCDFYEEKVVLSKNEQLELAINLASEYHKGQVDKSGVPYILHPLTVMQYVDTMDEKIVAILHDIVEDTPMTISKLKEFGFDDQIIEAINYLTRLEGFSYMEYIHDISECELAKKVKLADLKHNMRDGVTPSLLERYKKAQNYLLTGEDL